MRRFLIALISIVVVVAAWTVLTTEPEPRPDAPPAASKRSADLVPLVATQHTAASLPGQVGNQWSAIEAVFDRRGSSTATLAPRALASVILWAWGLK